jgi:hypothetical protein
MKTIKNLIGGFGANKAAAAKADELTQYPVVNTAIRYIKDSPNKLDQYHSSLDDISALELKLKEAEDKLRGSQLGKADQLEVALKTMRDHNSGIGGYELSVNDFMRNEEYGKIPRRTEVIKGDRMLRVVRVNRYFSRDPCEIGVEVTPKGAFAWRRYHSYSNRKDFPEDYEKGLKLGFMEYFFGGSFGAIGGMVVGMIPALSTNDPSYLILGIGFGGLCFPFTVDRSVRLCQKLKHKRDCLHFKLGEIGKAIPDQDERQKILDLLMELPGYVTQAEQSLIDANRHRAGELEGRIRQLDVYNQKLIGE